MDQFAYSSNSTKARHHTDSAHPYGYHSSLRLSERPVPHSSRHSRHRYTPVSPWDKDIETFDNSSPPHSTSDPVPEYKRLGIESDTPKTSFKLSAATWETQSSSRPRVHFAYDTHDHEWEGDQEPQEYLEKESYSPPRSHTKLDEHGTPSQRVQQSRGKRRPLSGVEILERYGGGGRSSSRNAWSHPHDQPTSHFDKHSYSYPAPLPYKRPASPLALYPVFCECCGFQHLERKSEGAREDSESRMRRSASPVRKESVRSTGQGSGTAAETYLGKLTQLISERVDGRVKEIQRNKRRYELANVPSTSQLPLPSTCITGNEGKDIFANEKATTSTTIELHRTTLSATSNSASLTHTWDVASKQPEIVAEHTNGIRSFKRNGIIRHQCVECGKDFSRRGDVYRHVNWKCGGDVSGLKCICGTVLSRGDALKRHEKKCREIMERRARGETSGWVGKDII